MSIVLSGDIHGTADIDKVVRYFAGKENEYTRSDYLIILGDAGVCGFIRSDEEKTREILRKLPVTVLFVDGNHEHFDHLNAYPVEIWNGGKVHRIEDNIIHLMRGQLFKIDGKSIFAFGGAFSVDRMSRTEGETWFAAELPQKEELEEGLDNLRKADYKVDYIISHTAPRSAVDEMGFWEKQDDETELHMYFQRVADSTEFKAWYFGHFHVDKVTFDKFYCVYNEFYTI